jgi:hypothetical protein
LLVLDAVQQRRADQCFFLKANRNPFLKLFFYTLGWMFLKYRRNTQNPILFRIGPPVRLTMPSPVLADALVQLFKLSRAFGEIAIAVANALDPIE